MTCGLLLPSVTLHFYLVFPRPKRLLERLRLGVLLLVYGPPVVFLVLLLNAYLRLRGLYPSAAGDSPDPAAVARTLREMLFYIYLYFGVAALLYLASVASLLQVDRLLSDGVRYFLLSFLAGVVYYGLAFVGLLLVNSRGGEGPSLGQAFLVSGTALVLLVALDLTRGRLKSVLDRHYRREKHQLDSTWRRMSEAI